MTLTRLLVVLLALATLGCSSVVAPPPPVDVSWMRQERLFDAFDPRATDTFSPLNAYLLALAAKAGDAGTADQQSTLAVWGFDRYTPFVDRNASVYAYVASSPSMVLVVFSGTDIRNLRDLQSDIDALAPIRNERYGGAPGALVHRGFAAGLDSIWHALTREVIDHQKPAAAGGTPKPLWVAGHSRGGAFAALAAAGRTQDDSDGDDAAPPHVTGLYTFGQPRVGNLALARALAGSGVAYYRIVNDQDAVAAVPVGAGRLAPEYAHAGTLAHLADADGPRLRFNPPDATQRLWVVDPDHYLDVYLRNLHAVLRDPSRIEDDRVRAATTRPAMALPVPR